ncbi:MAG: glycosyltransferase family 2 protein [Desmonostoc vinosum HA7617-LM4]|nr:glycosyltransferase family 2 protein [Desmonostoc vinosum HA7617-LM4]
MNQLLEEQLVSVIIPTYNRAHLISVSLNSAINQTYRNLEIIVVDDASVDNTEESVKSIGDSRIRYIRHQINCGGSATRNTGIEAATGEYIAFLDSDDIWAPEKIELQLASIQKHPHLERVVSYTQRVVCSTWISSYGEFLLNSGNFQIVPLAGKLEKETIAEYLFCNRGQIQTSTLMMPRSLCIETRFHPGLKMHQDWDFCLKLEANGAIFTFIEKPLTIWNADPRNDRISRIIDYQTSESWISDYQPLISHKAIIGFKLIKVLPLLIESGERKSYAQKLALYALAYRLISLRSFKYFTYKIWKIKSIRQRLKMIWNNSLGRLLKKTFEF